MRIARGLLLVMLVACGQAGSSVDGDRATVTLAGGGSALDDLWFSSRLQRVLVPTAQHGRVDLIQPDTLEVVSIGRVIHLNSADEGHGLVLAVDRVGARLVAMDVGSQSIVGSAQTSSPPDYVRFVASRDEFWVTLPVTGKIEVFKLGDNNAPELVDTIDTPDGPEGLTIDQTRNRAYAHLANGRVMEVELTARAVLSRWEIDCSNTHGIPALDEARGFLVVGCGSTKAHVLDVKANGAVRSSFNMDGGATLMAFNPLNKHVYVRGDPGKEVAVLALSDAGELSLLGKMDIPEEGHCMTVDDRGNLWVCDGKNGAVVRLKDTFTSP
ncbi:MAG: hypothetical protein AB2A00_37490 [Myxococcota bacterium]